MKNVLITGPTGGVGLALINELIANDISVTAIVRPDSSRKDRLTQNKMIQIVECDLDNLQSLVSTFQRNNSTFDTFYHLGWDHSRDHYNVDEQYKNIRYTLDAVRLANQLGIKTFIGAGSQAEYGRVEGKLSPDTPAFPETAYGMAKLCAGNMSRLLCKQLAIKHIWPRILSVYGPGDQPTTMIINTINTLLKGKKPSFTKGEQQWDFLYSEDCARALRLIGERGGDGSVYCIGSGKTEPLRTYIEILRNQINPDLSLGIGDLPYRDKQVMYLCADISNLSEDTGFLPYTSFQDGIKKTIEWCKINEK